MHKKKILNPKSQISNRDKVISGTIKITQKPLGFLDLENGDSVIIFEENLNCALNNDEVEVAIIGRDRARKKGRVVRIKKRNKVDFVGSLEKFGNGFVFVPDDFKFYKKVDLHPTSDVGQLKDGLKVLVKIEWTNPNLNPKGKILKIIGQRGEHETEMQSILLDKGIVYDFPEEVEKEAEQVSKMPFDTSNRRDFRDILTFTIDPKDAKDFDDALSYEEIDENKVRVGVHIADVSYFVQPGTALDREARERSFSTYLVDRTVPMLPEVLSNNLCSLMPNVDRLAFAAVFDIKKDTGEILNRSFGRTLINSNKRFTYEEAQEILNAVEKNSLQEFYQPLSELNRIANIYRAENKKNGAIEFETDEVKFELDDLGKPIRVYKKERLDTMKMIEDWMLLANREVAKFISDKAQKRGGAGLFRIHDLPNAEKLEELSIFVKALGHNLPIGRGGYVSAKDLNILLSEIVGHSSESLIKTAAIRSMAKAEYSTKNIGHFGLAFEYYTHFTSPIRRYPDLLVHRILDLYLNNKPISKNEFAKFQKIAEEASEKEIEIAEAERASIKYKQVEFMQGNIGKEFDCIISGVTEWGMYVEDPATKAEGLIRIKDMTDDFYSLDAKNYCLIGTNTKKKYSLGDSVHVRLVDASLTRKTLDFKLV